MAEEKPKISVGAGHAEGMLRKGFKELAAVLPAFPSQQHVIEEPGVFGNLTPGEIAAGKKEDAQVQTLNEEKHSMNGNEQAQAPQVQAAPQEYQRTEASMQAAQQAAAQQAEAAAKSDSQGKGVSR